MKSSSRVDDGTRHFIYLNRTGAVCVLYIDGVEEGTRITTNAHTWTGVTSTFRFGLLDTFPIISLNLDEFGIYDGCKRALGGRRARGGDRPCNHH